MGVMGVAKKTVLKKETSRPGVVLLLITILIVLSVLVIFNLLLM